MSYVKEQIFYQDLMEIKEGLNMLIAKVEQKAVKIEDEEKIGVRIMAEGREGMVRLLSKVASQHEDCLSRKDNAADLESKLQYDNDLEGIRQSLLELTELITGTQWGNSADIMETSDRFAKALQSQRSNDTALDSAMREIDEWNKRYVGANQDTPGETDLDAPGTPVPPDAG